jgi:hypothetical protein
LVCVAAKPGIASARQAERKPGRSLRSGMVVGMEVVVQTARGRRSIQFGLD